MRYIARLVGLALVASFIQLVAFSGAGNAQAASITVIVNGRSVYFDQPPVERAGRVFVPLRGVFERLGASVVYADGTINATGNGRDISLHLGSTQATVNGQPRYLDVPPFLIGARTLVPLRFVAQALGATVAWDQNSSTVRINGGNAAYGRPTHRQPYSSFALINTSPTGMTLNRRPTLQARFSEAVQRGSVRVRMDGTDITNNASISTNGFTARLSFPISRGAHRVRVTGMTRNGTPFTTGWTFTTP